MIAATRRWFRRNRTTLAVGAACIGATYLAGQYVVGKIQEARQRMSEERVGKENLRRRFEQNQEDCTYTVLALLPTIREEIIGALPVEQITEQLQQERQERLRRLGASEAASSEFPSAPGSVTDDAASALGGSYLHASQVASSDGGARPKRSKAQLWQEMKIHSIARALTLLYTVGLLTLLTRIQLNLLGRRTYLSSVVALAAPPAPMESSRISLENRDDDNYDNFYGNDFDTNRKYLTFSWWLLHRGSKQIMERVMVVVKEVFGGVNIREDVTLERLADLIMQCRRKIEGETEQDRREMKWLQYLLPAREQESFVIRQAGMSDEDSPSPEAREKDDPMTASAVEAEAVSPSLRRLLDETSDLIDSPTFTHVFTRLLDASFSHLVDYRIATESFKVSAPGAEQPRIEEVTDGDAGPTKCKLAHILPVFCRQAHAIAAGSGEIETGLDAFSTPNGTFGNEYLQAMDQVQDLRGFAAVIYSSNFEYEVAESGVSQQAEDFGVSAPDVPPLTSDDAPSREQAGSQAREATDSLLGESEVIVPEKVVLEDSPADIEQPAKESPQFEAAWKKALADEDGRQPSGSGGG